MGVNALSPFTLDKRDVVNKEAVTHIWLEPGGMSSTLLPAFGSEVDPNLWTD